jgi:hypothetical protein
MYDDFSMEDFIQHIEDGDVPPPLMDFEPVGLEILPKESSD